MKCIFEVNTICRLCLRVTEKIYRLNNTHLKTFIESIIKLKPFQYIPTDDEYVCNICITLLKKSFNYIQTVWNAQYVICEILKKTDKITLPMLESLDRHYSGLNSVNLSSVVNCDNEKLDNNQTNLDILADKHKEVKNNINKKIKNYFSNKTPLIISLISSSDEEKELDTETEQCNLDEVEVEIDYIKTEIGDPLTTDFYTSTHNILTPEPEQIKGKSNRNALHKAKSGAQQNEKKKITYYDYESDSTSHSEDSKSDSKKKIDEDYEPDSTSHSEDSEFDSFDDEGKKIKKPIVDRVYPRKCDHCDYEVLERSEHYRHYLYVHPNTEYPYKIKKNSVCSICGKLCTEARLKEHEESHVKQKLKCTICRKVYTNKLRLYAHMQNVHPKTKYTCDYCSKVFKRRNCITRHIRTHTGSKPFKCHICGEGFAHKGNVNIHIRSKHQNYKYIPKKQKRARKVRRNKKHNLTDTENSSDDEKTLRIIKRRTKTKRVK